MLHQVANNRAQLVDVGILNIQMFEWLIGKQPDPGDVEFAKKLRGYNDLAKVGVTLNAQPSSG